MIEVRVLGPLRIRVSDGRRMESLVRRSKRAALLAYLAAASPRGAQHRDKLLPLFWPESDEARARAALSQAVYVLRSALGEDAVVPRGHGQLGLADDIVWCDVAAFEDALDTGRPADALALYEGDLLDGFFVDGAPEFERWLDAERERLRQRAAGGAWALAEASAAEGKPLEAARWARRAVSLLPADETAVRRLMSFLDALGDRAAAIQAYEGFAWRLAEEYELEPSAETRALAETIRSKEPDVPTLERLREEGKEHAGVEVGTERGAGHSAARSALGAFDMPGTATARARQSGARTRKRVAIGAGTLLLVGGVLVASYRNPTRFDPELLAVAPFDIPDRELEVWHDGLVDVLSRNLDGAGPLRTVAPTVVLRHWEGRADHASARDLGGRTGAGVVVFGQLLRAGPDSVRLKAAVLDVRKNRTLAGIDRAEQVDRIDLLTDSLSLDVIRALTPASPQIPLTPVSEYPHRPLSFVGTKSLPALKAFLQGEHYLRRFALDSAIASYDRAIALDSTFPLALHAMGRARAWNLLSGAPYYARAGAHNRGLSPRDSLMIASDSQLVATHAWTSRQLVRRKLRILEEAVRRYPEDPEPWFELGDLRFHLGFFVQSTWSNARAAFDRAIALDSSFALAYIHPVEIALTDNDPDAALRYVQGYLAVPSVIRDGAGMHLLSVLLDRERPRPHDLAIELEKASLPTLRRVAFATRSWPDPEESQILVARRLLASARAGLRGMPEDPEYALRPYRSLLAQALIFRGHLQEARHVVGNRFTMPAFMELAELGAIAREAVETVVMQWFQDPDHQGDHVLFPWFTEGPCYRTMDAALWWASQKDTANLRRLVRREELAPRTADTLGAAPAHGRPAPEFTRAALALARGDTTSALSGFLAVHSAWCPDARQLREVRFRLLAAVGRDREAAEVFDVSPDRRVPMMLERARLAERLGDRPTAIHYYRFVVQAWLHADPELQPVVAEARAGLQRLGGDSGR